VDAYAAGGVTPSEVSKELGEYPRTVKRVLRRAGVLP